MEFERRDAPFVTPATDVGAVMRHVLYALIPAALFAVLQPAEIIDMVFHNSPYPSWHALAFTVFGTWALLRFLEACGHPPLIIDLP